MEVGGDGGADFESWLILICKKKKYRLLCNLSNKVCFNAFVQILVVMVVFSTVTQDCKSLKFQVNVCGVPKITTSSRFQGTHDQVSGWWSKPGCQISNVPKSPKTSNE